jgi:transcriptional regulator with XRE-family HTH domain
MSKISRNIAHLRRLKKLSQEQLADELGIKKSRLGAYEESRSEPPLDLLIRISEYFRLPVDILLKKDLSKAETIPSIEVGNQRVLFPISVDRNNKGLVEIIDMKASAGYLNGYADPEFIESLPKMQLPFAKKGSYRAFPIRGDSMPPLKTGAMIVGKFVEDPHTIKEGKTYILLTRTEGIVYKRIYRDKKNKNVFLLHSDNTFYQPYPVHQKEILETWSFVCSISTEELENGNEDNRNMMAMLFEIKKELEEIKKS